MGTVQTIETVVDLFRDRMSDDPAKTAFIFEGQSTSYGDLDTQSNQTAHALIDLGLQPDERVGYLGKNSHNYYELMLGITKAGGVICPINWRLAPPEIAYIINDAKIRTLFIGVEFVELIDRLKELSAELANVVIMEDAPVEQPIYERWRDKYPNAAPDIQREEEDAFAQLYTSGTTGNPKGAILSNRALLENSRRYEDGESPDWNLWTADDVSLIAMPCFHIGGTGWGLATLSNGATGVIMREFDATQILNFIDKFKISKLFLVPAAMQFVVNLPNAREVDYSRLQYMLCLLYTSPSPRDS